MKLFQEHRVLQDLRETKEIKVQRVILELWDQEDHQVPQDQLAQKGLKGCQVFKEIQGA